MKNRMLMPICIPYLNTSISYPNTLTRLSAVIHWTDTTRLGNTLGNESTSSLQPIRTLGNESELGSQSESSRQPIRIEHYVTQVVTRDLSAPGGPFSALGSSRLAIAYLNTWGLPPPPDQLTLLLLTYTRNRHISRKQRGFCFQFCQKTFSSL